MRRRPRTRPGREPGPTAGFSAVEATLAASLLLVVMGGLAVTTNSFTDSTREGRRTIKAVSNTSRADRGFARELMNATILDPRSDLEVRDLNGDPVPDEDAQGNPIVAIGPVFRLVKNVNYRLSAGQVIYDRATLEFRKDTAADLNGDGRTDQLLRILDPDGASPRTRVLANRVLAVSFRKHGAVVRITCTTRGGVKSVVREQGVYHHIFRNLVQSQVARPRNF